MVEYIIHVMLVTKDHQKDRQSWDDQGDLEYFRKATMLNAAASLNDETPAAYHERAVTVTDHRSNDDAITNWWRHGWLVSLAKQWPKLCYRNCCLDTCLQSGQLLSQNST